MKKILLFFLLSCFALSIFAAEHSQVVIMNTGKAATLKMTAADNLKILEKTQKDRKTGEQKFRCAVFAVTAKSSTSVKKITLKLEVANGELSILVGRKKASPILWTSFKVDGKELLNGKNGEIIVFKVLKAGKFDKKKEITLEASYRSPTRKELKISEKSSKKKSKKSSSTKDK